MGSNDFYPEERPLRRVEVRAFWIDDHPVTNAEFRRFIKATGYLTAAERVPDPRFYSDADPRLLVPGSLVFKKPSGPVSLQNPRAWWAYVPGACWKYPEGPGSSLSGRDRHPVVHVAYEDAEAYATWIGKALPTEAEWEFVARGGLDGATYVWGDEYTPKGRHFANTWQGEFPWQNLETDGYAGTSPVRSFPPNQYGVFDMAGNVWEWTRDAYSPDPLAATTAPCCASHKPRAEPGSESIHPHQPGDAIPRKVVKGGSHLCAPNYCLRYRPAAR